MARASTTRSATPRRSGFDRAFTEVVREGYLTAQEATARGNREAYSLDLQRRYGLSPELAIRVTDNRTRIAEAMREMERQLTVQEVSRPARWHLPVLILIVVALVALTANQRWARERDIGRELERRSLTNGSGAPAAAAPLEAELEPAPSRPLRVAVERDESGWVTRVTASHPDEVLAGFCATLTYAGTCASMQTGPTLPAAAGRRLGWFVLNNASLTTWNVQIRRQHGTGRWSVGTGLQPIVPFSLDAALGDGPSAWPFAPEPAPGSGAAESGSAKAGSPDRS